MFRTAFRYQLVCVFLLFIITSAYSQLKDADFFARVNLNYPGLSLVKQRVAENNLPEAKRLYVEFLRGRSDYTFFVPTILNASYPAGRRENSSSTAELALNYTFEGFGDKYTFPGDVNWKLNPFNNVEWVFGINRHYELRSLANAFYVYGNPIYSRKLNELLLDWLEDEPIPTSPKEPVWRTLEAGIRVADTWPYMWAQAIKAPELDNETIFLWVKSWMEHGYFLSQYNGSLNWLIKESHGLYTIAVFFPEFSESENWEILASTRLETQLSQDFYPDGVLTELTPHYHRLVVDDILNIYKLGKINKRNLSDQLTDNLEAFFSYLLKIMMPNRLTPGVNDNDLNENVAELMHIWEDEGLKYRDDFAWIASNGVSGSVPAYTSVYLPWAGQAVMRENWSTNSNYLMMECGPFGTGAHQHEDKLGITLAPYGVTMVSEAGTYTYDNSSFRNYCLSSAAHSVVLIDKRGQKRGLLQSNYQRINKPDSSVVWQSNKVFDYVAASFGAADAERFGTTSRLFNLGVWKRHVIYIKPDIFVIFDVIQPNDNLTHTYESLFHLNVNNATLNSTKSVKISESGKPGFSITPAQLPGLQAEIIKGQESPEILGWELNIDGDKKAIPTLRYKLSNVIGKAFFAYAFRGSPVGKSAPELNVATIEAGEGNIGLVVNDSIRIFIGTNPDGTTQWNGVYYPTSALIVKGNSNPTDLETGKIYNSKCNLSFNLAAKKTAIQSSTMEGFAAENAIDGNISGAASSISRTNTELQPWIEVDLGENSFVDDIILYDNAACCPGEIKNYTLFLSNTSMKDLSQTELRSNDDIYSFTFSEALKNKRTLAVKEMSRFLRVQLNGTGTLSLSEIEVMGCAVLPNLALSKPSIQSSDYFDYAASRAVNGSLSGGADAVTHTQFQNQPWWEVDLKETAKIEEIVLFNRTDCCQERLSNFYILISDKPFNTSNVLDAVKQAGVYSIYVKDAIDKSAAYKLSQIGRYVRIQLAGEGILSLSEVQIFGCSESTKSLQGCLFSSVNSGDIDSSSIPRLLLYPNPMTDELIVSVLGNWGTGESRLAIFTPQGKMVYEEKIAIRSYNEFHYKPSLQSLPTGIYYVVVSSETTRKSAVIVKN